MEIADEERATVNDANIRLVVNADDFGMTPEISRGIIRSHHQGCVTSTSVLGNCAEAELRAAKTLLDQAPALGVGVHLALVGGRPTSPVADVPSLVDGAGALPARPRDFLKLWLKGSVDRGQVEIEINNQIDRIIAAGLKPDHLNTHHHLGFLPPIGQALEAAARRHGIPGVRSAVEQPTMAWVTEPRRGLEAGILAGLSWLTRRRMGTLRHGPQSWGFVESGQLDEIRILEIIGRLGAGDHELICHPSETDIPARDAEGRPYHGAEEVTALCSERVRGALHRRGITLCRWKDLS
ncbi:MAG TPA: ChbG/HpnK family deacetylase [Polyangia bacterium]